MQRWNPYETVLNVNNVGNLQLKWKFDLGSMAGQFSSPAVANGVVYVGSSDNDSVYAVNASTGAKLWSFTVGGSVWRMGWFISAPRPPTAAAPTIRCMR
jgi:outer membrane protein assembly factor BamB